MWFFYVQRWWFNATDNLSVWRSRAFLLWCLIDIVSGCEQHGVDFGVLPLCVCVYIRAFILVQVIVCTDICYYLASFKGPSCLIWVLSLDFEKSGRLYQMNRVFPFKVLFLWDQAPKEIQSWQFVGLCVTFFGSKVWQGKSNLWITIAHCSIILTLAEFPTFIIMYVFTFSDKPVQRACLCESLDDWSFLKVRNRTCILRHHVLFSSTNVWGELCSRIYFQC